MIIIIIDWAFTYTPGILSISFFGGWGESLAIFPSFKTNFSRNETEQKMPTSHIIFIWNRSGMLVLEDLSAVYIYTVYVRGVSEK